jgi:hypothetical protein
LVLSWRGRDRDLKIFETISGGSIVSRLSICGGLLLMKLRFIQLSLLDMSLMVLQEEGLGLGQLLFLGEILLGGALVQF